MKANWWIALLAAGASSLAPAQTSTTIAALRLDHPDLMQIGNGESSQRLGEHPFDDDGLRVITGVSSGDEEAAYVFRREGGEFVLEARLDKPASAIRGQFGQSVAIDGAHAAVGGGVDEVYTYALSNGIWTLDAAPLAFSGCDGVCGAQGQDILRLAGARLVVGAPGINLRGAVHVFERTAQGYVQRQRVVDRDTVAGDRFGRALDLSGSSLLIGTRDGAMVYVETGGSFVRQAVLSGASGEGFGDVVRLQGDVALVGAPQADGAFAEQGELQIFQRSGNSWSQLQTLRGSATNARVGSAFDIDSDAIVLRRAAPEQIELWTRPAPGGGSFSRHALIEAPGRQLTLRDFSILASDIGADLGPNIDQGRIDAYALRGVNLQRVGQLQLPDGIGGDRFGAAVARSGEFGFVGAPGRDFAAGAVFRYALGTQPAAPLQLPRPDGAVAYGSALGFDGGALAVGAPDTSSAGLDSGAVYLYDGQTLQLQQVLTPTPGAANLDFGRAVALVGEHLLVGARESAFLYRRVNGSWTLLSHLQAPDALGYGSAVALSAFDGVIAAPQTALGAMSGVGACYAFALDAASSQVRIDPRFGDRFENGRYCRGVAAAALSPGGGDRYLAASFAAFDAQLGVRLRDEVEARLRGNDNNSQYTGFAGELINDPLRTEPQALAVAMNESLLLYAAPGGLLRGERRNGVYQGIDRIVLAEAPDASFASALALSGSSVLAGAPLHIDARGRVSGAAYALDLTIADALFGDGYE